MEIWNHSCNSISRLSVRESEIIAIGARKCESNFPSRPVAHNWQLAKHEAQSSSLGKLSNHPPAKWQQSHRRGSNCRGTCSRPSDADRDVPLLQRFRDSHNEPTNFDSLSFSIHGKKTTQYDKMQPVHVIWIVLSMSTLNDFSVKETAKSKQKRI